jgi:exo-beta-1,3-glucanase (GH17 family)
MSGRQGNCQRQPASLFAGAAGTTGRVSALFAVAAAAIAAFWAWLGAAVQMPPSPFLPEERAHCVSYAPFRGDESPFGPDIPIDPGRIAADLDQLKQITGCVRTYSIDHGLDRIAEVAARNDVRVLQGVWLSSFPELNRKQIDTAVRLARSFPDTIAAVVVGNEVLLRGEMSPPELARTIREVKSQVPMPVTYADVWEFWLRHPEIAAEVDFITIHILPYWEDFPIPSQHAADHVDAIRRRVVAAFPGKEIFVGEFGWPSAGRMRESALPSPVNQARAMHEVLTQAKLANFRINLIEGYDQPWKRQLEGTVGGHWGLFDAYRRQAKFAWGGRVSDHPYWPWQAGGGVTLAAAIFGAALVSRHHSAATRAGFWPRIFLIAIVAGGLIGWTFENVTQESLGVGGWLRSFGRASLSVVVPILAAAGLASGARVPAFAEVLRLGRGASGGPLATTMGWLLTSLAVLAIASALGLVFDPRYRDFPFAPLTGAAFPLLFFARWRLRPKVPAAELAMGATLALSAAYIIVNEGLANWQAIWLCAALIMLALILVREPCARG